jgi:hypothetical protein
MNHERRAQFLAAFIRRADSRRLDGRVEPGHGEKYTYCRNYRRREANGKAPQPWDLALGLAGPPFLGLCAPEA